MNRTHTKRRFISFSYNIFSIGLLAISFISLGAISKLFSPTNSESSTIISSEEIAIQETIDYASSVYVLIFLPLQVICSIILLEVVNG